MGYGACRWPHIEPAGLWGLPLATDSARWAVGRAVGRRKSPLGCGAGRWPQIEPAGLWGVPLAADRARWAVGRAVGRRKSPLGCRACRWPQEEPAGLVMYCWWRVPLMQPPVPLRGL